MNHYRLVAQRPDQHEQLTEIGGRSYSVPSIVEDDDGLRILLCTDYWLPVPLWVWASENGAAALVNVTTMEYVLASDFAESRTENVKARSFVLAASYWRPYRAGMSFLEMTDHLPLAQGADQLQEAYERAAEVDLGSFVHLHTHTEYSQLDGITTVEQALRIIANDGQRVIGVTDHGNCAVHAALQVAADKVGIRPIFGMEAYFQPDRFARGQEHRYAYHHLVLWALDDAGLRNLWGMSTEGYRDGLYDKHPRIDWDTLGRYHEGVAAGTACLRGPVVRPYLDGDEDTALANLGRLQALFPDRLYVELHANHLPEQIRANEWLVKVARERGLPLLAVVDAHYGEACEQHTHRAWISVQVDADINEESGMFGGGQSYHLMTEAEVREALAYLGDEVVEEAVTNTVALAARCTARIETKTNKPVFSRATSEWPDPVAHDVDRLFEMCVGRWPERIPEDSPRLTEYLDRFDREMQLLIQKGFCGYFLMVADFVNWAKDHGIFVGPGRGSGVGSLVAYLCRITEIDPIEHELMFERFMTEGRTEPPDFDIDFPSSAKQVMSGYVAERWGADHICVVGTHMRMKSKGILNDLARALKSTLPEDYFTDLRVVAAIIDEAEASTAGLGLPWDELWVQEAERLDPYRKKYPELFALADELHGRLKTFGKHPAGIIIDPDHPIIGNLPLRASGEDEDGPMVSQFDLKALEALGFIKFDLLNIGTLDTLQECVDLIFKTTGEQVYPYRWKATEEYADPAVFGEVSDGWTLGDFQIETSAGTRLTKRFRPQTVAELADVITLVRPGPTRSGLTETYFRRRTGDEPVEVPDPRLEPVLIRSNGCMLYQEDIMRTCMILAGYSSHEADEVRSILGKKKVEKVAAAGITFMQRAEENGTDPDVAKLLWEQMAEFAKYSFNRAHAFSYATVAYWCAWLKFHYPVQFLCAKLSTVKTERIPEFVEEARRMGYSVQPPDINLSGRGFTADAMAVRYGFLALKGLGEAACEAILGPRAAGPYTSFADFLERKGPKCDAGNVKILVRIGAFDTLGVHRRGLERLIEADEVKGSDSCRWKTDEPVLITGIPLKGKRGEQDLPNQRELPCGYDWVSEPREPSKQPGRFKPAKPLPAKCSRACRRFDPIPLPDPALVAPYTDEDIRRVELEMLGVYLSSTPFERLDPEDRAELATAQDVLSGEPGEYVVLGVIKGFRPTRDRHDREMGFLRLATERGELEVTVFSTTYARHKRDLVPGHLVLAALRKDFRGQQLDALEDLDAATEEITA